MNNPLKIYSGANALLYTTPINNGCRRRVQLMTEDSITVKFSDENKMRFPVGTRIGDFYITKEQSERYNANTGGYDYELKFDAYYWLWANKLLFYVMPGVTNAPKETSFKLTAPIDVHAAVILRALDACGFTYDGSPFRIDTDAEFSTEAKYISYANMSILGGIQAIADAYECEWWVVGNSIHFGKCNDIREYDFTVGDNVASITSDSKETSPNRLVVFGSTRNLPSNYRNAGSSDIVDAIVVKRLMLPEGTPYLQTSPDIPEDEIVEKEITLDSIYPHTSLIITDVVTYDSTADGTSHTFYRIKYGSSFLFSKDYILPDEELHVVFESGNLNGMDFAVKFNPLGVGEKKDDGTFNPDAQMLEIVVNEDYGRALPDDILHPEVGDKFSLYGWDSTNMENLGLLAEAERELLSEGEKLLAEYRKDKQTYTCPMMWDWCKNEAEKGNTPRLGSVVNLHFTKGDAGRKSRIIGYEHDLDIEYSNVTYICGEKVSSSRLKTLENKVEGLTHDGSKIKVQNSLDFLSKRYSDRSPYQIASDMGFEIGNYLAGVSGGMFGIDKTYGQSFADVFKLYVRGKAYFETLTMIESATLVGKQYITPGGAVKCIKVEEVKDDAGAITAYRCYFLSEQDGEKTETKIIAGDQAISEMFNAKTETTNKISNHRYWRLVTAVNNDADTDESGNHYGYIDLSATDCEADSNVPKEGDVIEQFGNRTDKTRQGAMVFSTVDPDSPSIKLLTGIGSGDTNAEHYTLDGKDIISQGYDHVKGHAFFKCYGDTYIGAPDGSTYVKYDQDTKQLDIKAKLNISSTIGDKTLNDYFTGLIPELKREDIEGFVNAIMDPKIDGIQDQIDGVIESFFGFGAPTLDNYPANEWTTDEARKAHERDTYTDKTEYVDDKTTPTAGQSWKWQYTSPTDYGWVKIADSDAVKALLDASKAQDTANSKRRTFTDTPSPPYDEGDMWVNAWYPLGAGRYKYRNDILRCETSRAKGDSFNIDDWELASKYTDDTKAQEAIESIKGYEYLKEAIVNGATQVIGGLFLSSHIRLGEWDKSNPDNPVFNRVYAGMNGVWLDSKGDRSIAAWYGGDMEDPFDYNAQTGRYVPIANPDPATRYAASAFRMDGSMYLAKGNLMVQPDGFTQWGKGSSAVTISPDGKVTLGNGIQINVSGSAQGLGDSIAANTVLLNAISNLFDPYSGDRKLTWGEVTEEGLSYDSVKVNAGLWTDFFLSARGDNPNGSGSGGASELRQLDDVLLTNPASGQALVYNGSKWVNRAIATGLDETALGNYLTTHKYATQPWVTSALGNYYSKAEADARFLRQHQSLADYVTLGTAQVISGVKTFTQEVIATDKWITAKIITGETGAANNTVQSKKSHGIELGYPNRDYMNFNEFGGVFNFYRTNLAYHGSGDGVLMAQISPAGVKSTAFIKNGGTSSQFLMADGSVKALSDTTVPFATNADLLDGWHATGQTGKSIKKSGFVTSSTWGLSSYWGKLATINVTTNEDKDITLYLHSTYNDFYGTLSIRIRINSGTESYSMRLIDGNIPADRIRLYKAADAPRVFELWVNVGKQWGVMNAMVLSETDRTGTETGTWVTMHTTAFSTVQTPALGSYISPLYLSLLNNASSATQLQTVRKIWGSDFNGTQDISGDMTGVRNINTVSAPIGTIYASNWFRSTGNTGWYSQTYGGGWYMTDTQWIRNFGNKGLYMGTAIIRTDFYYDREGYGGAAWYNGYGAYNTAIVNNSGQTPLMVAYRSGQSPAVTGANRLFSLELLNTGTELRFFFGGFGNGGGCPVLMTSYGELRVGRSIQSTAWFSDSGQIRANATGTNYFLGMGAATDGYAVIQGGNSGTGAIPLLLNPKGGKVGVNTSSPAYALDVNGIVRASDSIISTGWNQFRAIGGNYGFFIRNDGAHTYFMLTNSGDAYGSYNSLRPMYIVNSSGVVAFASSTLMVDPDGYASVNGTFYASVGIWTDGFLSARGENTSDIRLKTGVTDFNATDIIRLLRPVAFRWNDTARGMFRVFDTDDVQYGLIAQEVLEAAPWLVDGDMFGDGYMGVRYSRLIPVLLQGELEILRVTDDHESRIKELERENIELRNIINELQTNIK